MKTFVSNCAEIIGNNGRAVLIKQNDTIFHVRKGKFVIKPLNLVLYIDGPNLTPRNLTLKNVVTD